MLISDLGSGSDQIGLEAQFQKAQALLFKARQGKEESLAFPVSCHLQALIILRLSDCSMNPLMGQQLATMPS